MNLLYQARKYVERLKWSVIPINRGSKVPLLNSWKEYQTRFPTIQELTTWFTPQSDSLNLAIITGTISNLIVIDADSMKGVGELVKLGLTSPISVKTGRGRHFYFRLNEKIQNQVGVVPDVDIRGEGGYVIAPPSIHDSGRHYRWSFEPNNRQLLPIYPSQLLEPFTQKEESNEKGWIQKALNGLTNGNRNDTFTKIVGNLHDGRRTMDDIFTILRPYCVLSNFSEGELLNVIRSVTRYERQEDEEGSGRGTSETIYSFDKSWELYCERKERQSSFQGPELCTGLSKLDNLLFGLRRGEIYTIGARTGIGKTTLCLNITANLLQSGKRCLYLSTEMSFDTIWDRLFGIMGIKFKEFKQSVGGLSFFVSDIGNPSKERIRQMIQEVKPDVLILDHIQHLGDALSNRAQELGLYIKKLKDFAREFDIAIIVASQLNRGADSTNFKTGEPVKPQIYNLKECGGIEEESAVVILLNKEYVIDDTHDMYRLNVAKNRYGETGLIELSFDKSNTRMVQV